jgi:hypothetical protein
MQLPPQAPYRVAIHSRLVLPEFVSPAVDGGWRTLNDSWTRLVLAPPLELNMSPARPYLIPKWRGSLPESIIRVE